MKITTTKTRYGFQLFNRDERGPDEYVGSVDRWGRGHWVITSPWFKGSYSFSTKKDAVASLTARFGGAR